MKERKKETKK